MDWDNFNLDDFDLEKALADTEPTPEQKIENTLRSQLKYMNPDALWADSNAVSDTFIYQDGKLIHGKNTSHLYLARKYGWKTQTGSVDRDDMRRVGFILGRVGPMKPPRVIKPANVVAFWHQTDKKEVKECIYKLVSERLIDDHYYVLGDNSDVVTVHEYFGGKRNYQTATSPKFSPELLRQMHTMPSGQKKQLMAQQGYNPVSKTAQRPGTKWWAPKSESFKEWLKMHP